MDLHLKAKDHEDIFQTKPRLWACPTEIDLPCQWGTTVVDSCRLE